MLLLVCGDRNWNNRPAIWDALRSYPADTVVIHGACRGADSIAGEEARRLGYGVREFPAEWSKWGKAAGPIRNRQMLAENPDLVIAFHENLAASRGTADTVREARVRDIPVLVVTGQPPSPADTPAR
jgi:hypothetical protein